MFPVESARSGVLFKLRDAAAETAVGRRRMASQSSEFRRAAVWARQFQQLRRSQLAGEMGRRARSVGNHLLRIVCQRPGDFRRLGGDERHQAGTIFAGRQDDGFFRFLGRHHRHSAANRSDCFFPVSGNARRRIVVAVLLLNQKGFLQCRSKPTKS